jgi:hypothetical protein
MLLPSSIRGNTGVKKSRSPSQVKGRYVIVIDCNKRAQGMRISIGVIACALLAMRAGDQS